jgi:crossover junction endodeoxyribonuclease RuvC|tara:strand:+ start:781 stop:1338 length:558 start_codon:yes stop_codon:yes gene_type:complete
LLILGIDPGSITTGWALLKSKGNKVYYVASGVLRFDQKKDFMSRLGEIKQKSQDLIEQLQPDQVVLESLIYVKSPTALMKLAQTRGVILSNLVQKYENKIFEYSPNFVKSVSVGHGHADKQSVKKFLDMMLGARDYATHDESDAVAIALCHIVAAGNEKQANKAGKTTSKKNRGGLSASLAHKVG